jgi:hypothetical protein
VVKIHRQVCKERGHLSTQEVKEESKPASAYGNDEEEFLEEKKRPSSGPLQTGSIK